MHGATLRGSFYLADRPKALSQSIDNAQNRQQYLLQGLQKLGNFVLHDSMKSVG